MNDKIKDSTQATITTPAVVSKNLQLTKLECKHLSNAIMTYVKQLEREARKHGNSGRSAVAELIMNDAATVLNVHAMLNQ